MHTETLSKRQYFDRVKPSLISKVLSWKNRSELESYFAGIGVTLTVVMGAVGATAEVATEAETAAENAEVATRWVGTAISAAGVAAEAEALGGIVILGGTSMKDQVIKLAFYFLFSIY